MQEADSKPKYQTLDREQGVFTTLQVEHLIGPDHAARAIWQLVGRLDLSRFEQGIESREAQSGRPCWPPQLLISIWVYGYSQGVASARELERRMEWEPGLRWLWRWKRSIITPYRISA
jgi:transposase